MDPSRGLAHVIRNMTYGSEPSGEITGNNGENDDIGFIEPMIHA
tara:strand:+ start:2535 stop:2666 length:132 start_codon:yes stop_codon:yes gene_type:complete